MTAAAIGRPSTPATSWRTTGAPDLRIRLPVLAVAVILGIAVGVGVDVWRSGGPTLWLARQGWLTPYAAEGRLVDIGGRSLYIDCRGSGSPTVVFEAGAGGDAERWGAVFPETATFTRACVYNRAGLHRSDPPPTVDRTAADVADDLATLLTVAGERPPYVLVAHSLGGVYARIFAARVGSDVVGIVFDDAFHPDLFDAQVAAAPAEVRDDWLAGMDAAFDQIESIEGIDWEPTAVQLAGSSVDGIPVEIIVASRAYPGLDAEQTAAVDAARLTSFTTLSSQSRVTVADGAGHFVHLTRPNLVLDAIRRLAMGARGP